MSSFSEHNHLSSSQFRAPQSAQPRSLFGGPSSDVGVLSSPQPGPPHASLFGGPSSQEIASDPPELNGHSDLMDEVDSEHEETDFDMIMRERPLKAHYDSDGDSFEGEGKKAKKQKQKMKSHSDRHFNISGTLSPAETTRQTYVLDRGLDLPPGVERPNRWNGPSASYSNVIEGERGVYDSMNTARSRDLAAHLYNAYAIRNKLRRHSETMIDEDEPETLLYLPKRWVAWPLPSEMVPRVDEALHRQLDPHTLSMPPDIRPSAELENSIMAQMMKTAKERFMAREWDGDEVKTTRAYSPNNPDDMKDIDNDKKQDEVSARRESRPVVQADDNTSQHQLRPLSRNVISQLDQVLTGLHHSMKNRYHRDTTSDGSSTTDSEDEASRSRSGPKNGKGTQPRGRKRAQKGSRTPETPSERAMSMQSSTGHETDNESMHSTSRSRGWSRASHDDGRSINHKITLRDWSEVIGLAAMTGLPSAVVMRASKRCADLFGQDMAFRTLGETRVKKATRGDSRSWRHAYVESDTDPDAEIEAVPRKRGRPRNSSQNKARSQSRRPRSQSATAPAPPSQQVPLPTSSSAGATDTRPITEDQQNASYQQSAPRSGVGKGPHRKADIICPVMKCPRHKDGFSRVWNLNLHMKRVHPHFSGR